MSTVQKLLRNALVSRIQTALPAVTIFRAPRRELADTELPAVCIFGQHDRPQNADEDDHSKAHARVYTVRVEIRAKGLVEDDTTDVLAVAVRGAVLTEDTLGGLCDRTTWGEQLWDGDEGDPPLSGTALEFNHFYLWRPE